MNAMYMCHCNSFSGCVFVKSFECFEAQKGTTEDWGKNWVPFFASSIEHARLQASDFFKEAKPYESQAGWEPGLRARVRIQKARKIYLASSWRNERQPYLVDVLRKAGHEVYDFRNPTPGNNGFSWREIDGNWREWTPEQYREALKHPVSKLGLGFDYAGMRWANTFVALAPFGRSASLELGWAIGAARRARYCLLQASPS